MPPFQGGYPAKAKHPAVWKGFTQNQLIVAGVIAAFLLIGGIGSAVSPSEEQELASSQQPAVTKTQAPRTAPPPPTKAPAAKPPAAPVKAPAAPKPAAPPVDPAAAKSDAFRGWILKTLLMDHMSTVSAAAEDSGTSLAAQDFASANSDCRRLVSTSEAGLSSANSPDPVLNGHIKAMFTASANVGQACLRAISTGDPAHVENLLANTERFVQESELVTARMQLAALGKY